MALLRTRKNGKSPEGANRPVFASKVAMTPDQPRIVNAPGEAPSLGDIFVPQRIKVKYRLIIEPTSGLKHKNSPRNSFGRVTSIYDILGVMLNQLCLNFGSRGQGPFKLLRKSV